MEFALENEREKDRERVKGKNREKLYPKKRKSRTI